MHGDAFRTHGLPDPSSLESRAAFADGGDIAFAESYMDGDWSTPDLTTLIELAVLNHDTIMPSLDGSRLARLVNRLSHLRRNNTKRGSRQNIPAHYDLGNEFYAAWLDPGMTYSSGFYAEDGTTLELAQIAKQDLVMEALTLSGGGERSGNRIWLGWAGGTPGGRTRVPRHRPYPLARATRPRAPTYWQ